VFVVSRLGAFFMDDKMGDIKYVQLEAGDFLADSDFQLMTAAERGIYCSIIFYMYRNDGRILNDPKRIKILTNSDENFEKSWNNVRKKFSEKNGYLSHKRVRKELARAKKFVQTQRKAGLKGAEKRWGRHNDPNSSAMAKPMANKVKESKVKESKHKDYIQFLDFVKLTKEEVRKLIDKFGEQTMNVYIEDLNNGIGSKGYKYKSHYHTILTWYRKDLKEGKTRTENVTTRTKDTKHQAQCSADRGRDFSEQESAFGETISNE
jgi:uncharacterized protein YdaU (DUF1376 family)